MASVLVVNDSYHFLNVRLCGDFSCKFPEIIWNCLPPHCKVNYTILVSLFTTLGILICVANITVLLVYVKRLRDGNQRDFIGRPQIYYKLSLACADLLMGFIVCPCAVINFFINFKGNYTWQHLLAAQSIWDNIVYASFFHPSFLNTAYQIYYTVIGCITFTSWAVSCMTLMLASADRFLAIAYPKFYLKKRGCGNTLFTIAAIICCWGVGTVIGCIPLIRDDTEFEGWTIILFVSGAEGLIIVAVLIAIPLVGMWLFNILTFVTAKRQLRTTQQINVHLELNAVSDAGDTVLQTMIDDNEEPNGEVKGSSASNDVSHTDGESPDGSLKTVHEQQRRLAVTLAIVVGTFTLAFLPVCIALSVSGGTYYEEHNNLIIWLSVLCISNSFWNCIIYSVRQKEFRKDAAAIYRSCFCCFTERAC